MLNISGQNPSHWGYCIYPGYYRYLPVQGQWSQVSFNLHCLIYYSNNNICFGENTDASPSCDPVTDPVTRPTGKQVNLLLSVLGLLARSTYALTHLNTAFSMRKRTSKSTEVFSSFAGFMLGYQEPEEGTLSILVSSGPFWEI